MTDVVLTFKHALGLIEPATRRRVVAILCASVAVALLDLIGLLLLVPFLTFVGGAGGVTGLAFDVATHVLPNASTEHVVLVLALVAVIVFIVKGVASMTLLWVQTGVLYRAQGRLSVRVARTYARMPWLAQQATDTGTLIRSATNAVANSMTVISATIGAVAEIAVFGAVLAALVIVNPLLALGAVAYLLVAGLAYLRLVRRTIERRGRMLQAETRRMNVALIELVGGIRELTVRDTVDSHVERFSSANRTFLSSMRLIWVANMATRYFLEMLMITGVAIAIGIASVAGSVSGALVAIGLLLAGGMRLVPSLSTLLIAVNNIRVNMAAVAVVRDELDRLASEDQDDRPLDVAPLDPTGAFALRGVSFRYPTREAPALAGVTIDVAAGEAIGIVGTTGSGKSTFVDLLLGLLEPDAGLIEIDGEPLRDHIHAWRSRIGFVPQDIFLADDTLAANISFGLPEAPDADRHLARAVSLAHLDDVVVMLPDGLGTVLGERGVRLSGGQRQRVGLARALYGDPSILILDEATSALDNETERSIGEALQSLHGQLTMVVIAHRLSTVRACDRIAFLEAGRITGIGTFDELARDHAGFARLVELGSLGETG